MSTEIVAALITTVGSIIVALIAKAGGTRQEPHQSTGKVGPTPADSDRSYSYNPTTSSATGKQSAAGSYFLLTWICACIAGWTMAWAVGLVLIPGNPLLGNLIGGLIVGVAQWFVIKDKLRGSSWWILATACGSAIGGLTFAILGIAAFSYFGFLLANIVGGISVGVAQWLILRRQVPRSGHWILVSAVAWTIGGTIGNVIAFAGGGLAIGGLVCGLIFGFVTGSQFILLINQSNFSFR
jgi:hypothetical protein